jgi:hypothetical protein
MSKVEVIIQIGTLLVGCVVFVLTVVQLVSQKRQIAKDQLCREPFFVSGAGSYGEEAKVQFRNDGGSIRNIAVEPDGDFQVSFVPPNSMPTGCEGKMIISNYDDSKELCFQLRYETAAGEVRSKKFAFYNRVLREVAGVGVGVTKETQIEKM